MRKTFASFMAVVSAVAAFGVAAGPAAADDPNTTEYNINPTPANNFFHGQRCETQPALGVLGIESAWRAYVDGCTSNPVRCWNDPVPAGSIVHDCTVRIETTFDTETHYRFQVTQNARLWITDIRGDVRWRDFSCSGVDSCSITETVPELSFHESVAVQCNGQDIKEIVRPNGDHVGNWAHNSCSVSIKEPPLG